MTDEEMRNFETAKKAYQDGNNVISPNIVWHVPGKNPVSGVYRGAKAYLEEMVSKMQPIDEWIIDVEDIMVNGSMAVVALRLRGKRKHHRIDMNGVHVMRIEKDKVVEGWGFNENQDVVDEFFAA